MDKVIDISWFQLGLFSLVLLIPLALARYYRLSLNREIIISVVRMSIQLGLVGLYLEYLFLLNSLIVNVFWVLVMISVGASSILNKAELPKRTLMLPIITGLACGMIPILLLVTIAVVHPTPYYHAQYTIPLAGMLLGNTISGNIIALQNLFTAFEQRKEEYHAAISLGASPRYASQPFVQVALKKAMAPILANMSTIGLVTLPGMMTGQILGGVSPLIAIKYQLMIMIAIFVVLSISVTLSLHLVISAILSKEGRVKVVPKSAQS
jgi:putative ABC transport system permease protein